ncbi:YcfL family protein [Pseudomonas sp. Z1-14]|uniref:YcfL family protein n=1 Tax=unclassified Pseudomonas TaxID=196821 RepID=UPI003DA97B56
MRLKLIAVGALALLAGCATPPPPEQGTAASKVVAMGKTKNIVVGAMRVARENGYMTVNVQLSNTSFNNKTMYYRFAWLGPEGFPIAEEESWKTLTLYGEQTRFLPAIAPTPKAVDFRLEINTP